MKRLKYKEKGSTIHRKVVNRALKEYKKELDEKIREMVSTEKHNARLNRRKDDN